jgi:hypothetical protein
MLDLDATFEKLLGRPPSEKEVLSLYRVKNALNIRDNDALWLVLMALEFYDTLYRKYSAVIAEEVSQIVEDQRTVMAALAEAETRKALGTLADTVSKTSESRSAWPTQRVGNRGVGRGSHSRRSARFASSWESYLAPLVCPTGRRRHRTKVSRNCIRQLDHQRQSSALRRSRSNGPVP